MTTAPEPGTTEAGEQDRLQSGAVSLGPLFDVGWNSRQPEGARLGMTRVAIIGSRDYAHLDNVRRYVETLPSDTIVVSGGARGVDQVAAEAGRARGLVVEEHLPDYRLHGPAAPMIRNGVIVAQAELVVAFWDGASRGTKDAINRGRRLGKRVLIIRDVSVPMHSHD